MKTESIRRYDLSKNTPLEVKFYELIQEVEKSGHSISLTKCVISLSEAKNHLADHIDNLAATDKQTKDLSSNEKCTYPKCSCLGGIDKCEFSKH